MSGELLSALDASSDGDGSLLLAGGTPSAVDRFDEIVAALEECVMGGDTPLHSELEAWCRAHCAGFKGATLSGGASGGEGGGAAGAHAGADAGTHPVEWMSLFRSYTDMVEARLEAALRALSPPAEMDEVAALFTERADELAGDVFDILFSLGNYDEFVSLMRSYNEQLAFEDGRLAESGVAGLAPVVTAARR
jgi:hypothetical protein